MVSEWILGDKPLLRMNGKVCLCSCVQSKPLDHQLWHGADMLCPVVNGNSVCTLNPHMFK